MYRDPTERNLRRGILLIALLSLIGGAIAQQVVDQGAPGNQGPWPVTASSSSSFPVTPQKCSGGNTSKITSVGVTATTTPSTQLASRRYVVLCNSLQNTGNPTVKCRADGVAPVMAASSSNPGDVLGVGDCLPYYVASTVSVQCIADAAGTLVTSSECL